jgi:hypothetical protein
MPSLLRFLQGFAHVNSYRFLLRFIFNKDDGITVGIFAKMLITDVPVEFTFCFVCLWMMFVVYIVLDWFFIFNQFMVDVFLALFYFCMDIQ